MYAYVIDRMGNITIRRPHPDDGTESLYLQGDDARVLEQDLESATDEGIQLLLDQYDVIEQWDRDVDPQNMGQN